MTSAKRPYRTLLVWLFCALPVVCATQPRVSQNAGIAALALDRAGIAGGICSLPRCGDGELAVTIATSGGLLVHGTDSRAEMVQAARERVDRAGLLGTEVVIEKGSLGRLPYADNTIDLVVIADLGRADLDTLTGAEVLRVLRPEGKAILGQTPGVSPRMVPRELKEWAARDGIREPKTIVSELGTFIEITKPALDGVDDWTHWFHRPDNNPVSTDAVIKAPYIAQWLGLPYYVAMPTITTAAGGRLFTATGHIAHHEREVPTLNLLTARNGYNGRVLWTRKLPDGYLVHRSAFIATDDLFYLIDGSGCLVLEPETGQEKGRFGIDGITGGWNWMALTDGVVYAQASDKPGPAVTTRVSSDRDHWSWAELSPGYYTERVPWGFGRHLGAYDLKTRTTLWTHTEPEPIDSRAIGMCGDRLYFYAPDSRIGCLDATTGELLWTNGDPETLEKIEQAGKGLASTPGFRSTCMLLCTPDVLFFQAQTRQNVVAVSAKSGEFLWQRAKTRNDPTLLFLNGELITSHVSADTLAVDPITGEENRKLGFRKLNCTRMTATSDSLLCRGEGLGRYDRNDGVYRIDGSVRPGCNDGAIPANGLLYVGPWCCDCNLSLMGTVTLCSAGDFDPAKTPPADERLEQGDGDPGQVQPLSVDELDWPTYRANNQRNAASKATVTETHPRQAWSYRSEQSRKITAPTTAGAYVFLGREDGKVQCIDAATGEPKWEFVTAGPVLQPPTIWEGRAYVGSGDGWVYCLEALTGRMLWRFRAAPVERKIMVYGKLCSTWPVNSGVLVHDGVAYAAAGIIDRDGTYVYALDAKTGKLVWENNTTAHLDPSLRKGVSAQGTLAVARGRLWLAAGNQMSPAPFDLKTGECNTWLTPRGHPSTPRGAEIGVWMDEYIVHGGRLLYSDPGKIINPGQFSFVPLDEKGSIKYPAMMPIHRSSIPPAWNDKILVALTQRYNQLVCWDNDLLLKAFEVRQKEEELRQEAMQRNPDQGARMRKRWNTDGLLDNLFRHTGKWGPEDRETLSVVIANNFVVTVSGPAPWNREEQKGTWTVLGFGPEDGKTLWWRGLPSEPLANGLIIDREGRIIVALKNGEILCLEEPPEETTSGG